MHLRGHAVRGHAVRGHAVRGHAVRRRVAHLWRRGTRLLGLGLRLEGSRGEPGVVLWKVAWSRGLAGGHRVERDAIGGGHVRGLAQTVLQNGSGSYK